MVLVVYPNCECTLPKIESKPSLILETRIKIKFKTRSNSETKIKIGLNSTMKTKTFEKYFFGAEKNGLQSNVNQTINH